MTNKSEEYDGEKIVFERDKNIIGQAQAPPLQQMLEKTEPAFVMKTEQFTITKFIDINNKRISVTLEDFRGDIEITIKKHEFFEEEDSWEICEQNIFTPIEIQALNKLFFSLGRLVPQTQKNNSKQ